MIFELPSLSHSGTFVAETWPPSLGACLSRQHGTLTTATARHDVTTFCDVRDASPAARLQLTPLRPCEKVCSRRLFCGRMGKRKLRSCTNCGGRHGPPTGRNCAHGEPREREKVADTIEKVGERAAAILDRSDEDARASGGEAAGADSQGTEEDLAELTLSAEGASNDGDADHRESRDRPGSPAGSGAMGALFLRQQMRLMQQERIEFEERVDGRMRYMENVLGKVAGVQQAQLERLVDLTTASKTKKVAAEPMDLTKKDEVSEPTTPQPAAAAAAAAPPTLTTPLGFGDFSDTAVPDADEDWKNYHGYAAWHLENERKKKNPFDHQAFLKKGEKITSFEDLMSITFKTLGKLVEMRCEVKGLIAHGRFMAEKASKDVFVDEAFVSYDEGVRKRAGETGPTAFGHVLQEEVFLHFCFENTKKQRSQARQLGKASKTKTDKTCNRFNDGGCSTKSCAYAHKCSVCDSWNHSKKKCDSPEKKKEGK